MTRPRSGSPFHPISRSEIGAISLGREAAVGVPRPSPSLGSGGRSVQRGPRDTAVPRRLDASGRPAPGTAVGPSRLGLGRPGRGVRTGRQREREDRPRGRCRCRWGGGMFVPRRRCEISRGEHLPSTKYWGMRRGEPNSPDRARDREIRRAQKKRPVASGGAGKTHSGVHPYRRQFCRRRVPAGCMFPKSAVTDASIGYFSFLLDWSKQN